MNFRDGTGHSYKVHYLDDRTGFLEMTKDIDVTILGIQQKFRGDKLVIGLREMGVQFRIFWGKTSEEFERFNFREIFISWLFYGRVLSLGEVACRWGHEEIIRSLVPASSDWFLILEDNLEPKGLDNLITFLNNFEEPDTKPYLINFLTTPSSCFITSEIEISGVKLFGSASIPTLSKCYALNRSGVVQLKEGLIRHKSKSFQADFPPFYARYVNFIVTNHFALEANRKDSIIGFRQSTNNKKSPPKIALKIFRIILGLILGALHIFVEFNAKDFVSISILRPMAVLRERNLA